MPQIINTNTSSLIGQRNLDRSQVDLQSSLERLSSGLRVNRAADDAAGLAIAATMTRQISGFEVTLRNANDADSFLQVAEGGLDIVQNILIRMKDLALQSANGSNSAGERANLDAEYQQLLAEIDRIVNTTTFNGEAILTGAADGSANFRTNMFQVDIAGDAYNIDLTLYQANARNLGIDTNGDFTPDQTVDSIAGTFAAADSYNDSITMKVTENGVSSYVNVDLNTVTNVNEFILSFNAAMGAAGFNELSAVLTGGGDLQIQNNGSSNLILNTPFELDFTASQISPGDLTLTAGGGTGNLATGLTDGTELLIDIATNTPTVNLVVNGVTQQVTFNPDTVDLNTFLSGISTAASGLAAQNTVPSDLVVTPSINALTGEIEFTYSSNTSNVSVDSIKIETDTDIIFGGQVVFKASEDFSLSNNSIAGTSIDSVANSIIAMENLDGAITMVSTQRAVIGASQNRLSETIKNTSSVILNISLSRSRIMDADFAQETSSMSRGQILQQAGISILAQANQLPQNVLQLLQ